jgi:uncharacterized membrane protein
MFLHGSPERRPGGDRDTARTARTAGRIDRRHLFDRPAELGRRRRSLPPPLPTSVADEQDRRLSRGERMADGFARVVGSWRFIGIQTALLCAWVALNAAAWIGRWDPYPFILLNLMLSFQAAYAGPIIMMSQNRAAERDRLIARNDFTVNQRAEAGVEEILALLHAQARLLDDITRRIGPGDAA